MQTNPTPSPSSTAETPRIYSRREAAAMLHITRETLCNLHHRGEGPVYYRRGKLAYYLYDDLIAWIKEGRRSK